MTGGTAVENVDYRLSFNGSMSGLGTVTFPPGVPEFFIRFLTEPGRLVLDPFGGSNVTGQVAEDLGRRWISIELNADYVAGSRLRFADAA